VTVSAYWITSAIARRSECSIRPFTGYDQPLNIQIERSNPDLSRSVYRSNAALVRNTGFSENGCPKKPQYLRIEPNVDQITLGARMLVNLSYQELEVTRRRALLLIDFMSSCPASPLFSP
jgi:hypothetical protein